MSSKTFNNLKLSMEVDLCFVLDCTGSMSSHIAAAKDCIINVVEHMNLTNPNIKLNVAFCGYRDHCDGENRLQFFEFTNSYSEFKSYISTVSATGGGDAPEDVLGGLDAAVNKLKWTRTTRIILHVCDAPPHGRRFTEGNDSYPEGDPHGLTAEGVLQKMKSKNIFYYFGSITSATNTMVRVFHDILGEFPEFDLDTTSKNPKALCEKFFNATCSAITSSVTRTSTSAIESRVPKNLKLDLGKPNWPDLPVQNGELMYYSPLKTLENIRNHFTSENILVQKYTYKLAPKPFSLHTGRYSYFALDVANESNEIIMKEYDDVDESANDIEPSLEVIAISTIARFLAQEFNSVAARVGVDKKVEFLEPKVVHHSNNQCHTVEPILCKGEFKRFNANSGVVIEFRPILEAFAHFTYKFTGGYLVVYDLQGSELSDKFLLTDPAIHCTDSTKFGMKNFGEEGIDQCFLANHKCNDVCKKLGF